MFRILQIWGEGDSLEEKLQKKYIPMTETTYYTLLSVTSPRHGYAIMQYVSELTQGRIVLGTGTLYTMVGRLSADGVITAQSDAEGRKAYQITETGMKLLKKETVRLKQQLTDGVNVLSKEAEMR
jgi:DNA-binding PadR family transcriptional regulator